MASVKAGGQEHLLFQPPSMLSSYFRAERNRTSSPACHPQAAQLPSSQVVQPVTCLWWDAQDTCPVVVPLVPLSPCAVAAVADCD